MRIGFTLLSLAVVALAFPAMARAPQSRSVASSDAPNSAAFQDAFAAMLRDPSNEATTLRYTRLAVAKGDYESAVSPLERLLITRPGRLDLRLEVGVLYYLLGSHQIARGYLHDVATDPAATPSLTARANDYLARL